jgi:hypothetical protein
MRLAQYSANVEVIRRGMRDFKLRRAVSIGKSSRAKNQIY